MNYSYGSDVAGAGYILAGLVAFMLAVVALVIASFIFWIVMLIDLARREFPAGSNDKVLWLILMIIFGAIGAVAYYFLGRQHGTLPAPAPAASAPTQTAETRTPESAESATSPTQPKVTKKSTKKSTGKPKK